MTIAACNSDTSLQCGYATTTFQPVDAHDRLFIVARADTTCGAFALSLAAK